MVRLGRSGKVRFGRLGAVRFGEASLGKVRQGAAGVVRPGRARYGRVRLGLARQARHKERKEIYKMSAYKWTTGARCAVDANIAGAVCEQLEERGELTAERLVDVSRPEDAPLHGAFEWNDAIAAEKYRVTQAGYIIRSLVVVVESEDEAKPIRAYFPTEVKHYENIRTIIETEDKRKKLLQTALQELTAFKRKYAALSELCKVFAAIDAAVDDEQD